MTEIQLPDFRAAILPRRQQAGGAVIVPVRDASRLVVANALVTQGFPDLWS
jgi:hypothetical protein